MEAKQKKEDIDKLKSIIIRGFDIFEDIEKAKADGEITWSEKSAIAIKHSIPTFKLAVNFKEIWEEVKDIDGEETTELLTLVIDEVDGSQEAKEAFKEMAEGAGKFYSGINKLIELRKQKD